MMRMYIYTSKNDEWRTKKRPERAAVLWVSLKVRVMRLDSTSGQEMKPFGSKVDPRSGLVLYRRLCFCSEVNLT
jgi:hypothetical protein